jgi:hypothetical protein
MDKHQGMSEKDAIPQGQSGEASAGVFTLLQSHYLGLLERVIDRKNSYQTDPGREGWILNAINKAAYSAYRSCVEHGVEEAAKAILSRERLTN